MGKKILYISSLDPTKGPGAIAMDHYKAFKQYGYEVDFLTMLPVESHPEIKYVLKKPYPKYSFHQISYKLTKLLLNPKYYKDHGFFYRKETEAPIPFKKLANIINIDYDIIVVYFWQRLMSYYTLKSIFEHNIANPNPKVVFFNADYSTITGGCHFIGECRNYKFGCGECPMINSSNKNDFTSWNVKFRKAVIERLKPYVFTNSYMRPFFENSFIMNSGATICNSKMVLDLNKFSRKDRIELNLKYDIPGKDNFVMLFGCQDLNDERKGMKYLIQSINYFLECLSKEEKDRVLIVTIGNNSKIISDACNVRMRHLGFVSVEVLPEIYSLADVYLSPSINDAGPSMVNQAIACETPVIAFEIGSALDVVKDKGTGFCVPLKDTKAFSDAIHKIYKMDALDYKIMKDRCRTVAMEMHSYKSFINNFEKQINK